jgi:hypothetical protein
VVLAAASLPTCSLDVVTVLPCSGSPGGRPHRGGADFDDARIGAASVGELDDRKPPYPCTMTDVGSVVRPVSPHCQRSWCMTVSPCSSRSLRAPVSARSSTLGPMSRTVWS